MEGGRLVDGGRLVVDGRLVVGGIGDLWVVGLRLLDDGWFFVDGSGVDGSWCGESVHFFRIEHLSETNGVMIKKSVVSVDIIEFEQ